MNRGPYGTWVRGMSSARRVVTLHVSVVDEAHVDGD